MAGAACGALALSAWAALSPLAAAVVAEGTVKASGNRKSIGHAEGGIVAAIHVKDGDTVQAGQTLITLADQRVAASADSLRQQWVTETLKAKRFDQMNPFELEAAKNALKRFQWRVGERRTRRFTPATKGERLD